MFTPVHMINKRKKGEKKLYTIYSSFICCCSGTLSYIFNNFMGKVAFSEVVTKAKQAGFTEPDPRDDLSGADVRRKVLCV